MCSTYINIYFKKQCICIQNKNKKTIAILISVTSSSLNVVLNTNKYTAFTTNKHLPFLQSFKPQNSNMNYSLSHTVTSGNWHENVLIIQLASFTSDFVAFSKSNYLPVVLGSSARWTLIHNFSSLLTNQVFISSMCTRNSRNATK